MHWPFWDYLDHSSWAAGQDLTKRAWPTTPAPEQGRQGQQWRPKPRALSTSLVSDQGQARPGSCALGLADSWAVVEQKTHRKYRGITGAGTDTLLTWGPGFVDTVRVSLDWAASERHYLFLLSDVTGEKGLRQELSLSSKRAQLCFFFILLFCLCL